MDIQQRPPEFNHLFALGRGNDLKLAFRLALEHGENRFATCPKCQSGQKSFGQRLIPDSYMAALAAPVLNNDSEQPTLKMRHISNNAPSEGIFGSSLILIGADDRT